MIINIIYWNLLEISKLYELQSVECDLIDYVTFILWARVGNGSSDSSSDTTSDLIFAIELFLGDPLEPFSSTPLEPFFLTLDFFSTGSFLGFLSF